MYESLFCRYLRYMCYNYSFVISVRVHLDASMSDKEVRLQEAVTEAVDRHEKVDEEYESVMEKVENLKQMLRPGVVMSDEEMVDLVKDINVLKAEMQKSKDKMKSATSALKGAHPVTLEVLGSAGEVKLMDERFSRKG